MFSCDQVVYRIRGEAVNFSDAETNLKIDELKNFGHDGLNSTVATVIN